MTNNFVLKDKRLFVSLSFEHNAKIMAICTIEPIQDIRAVLLVDHKIVFTHFLPDPSSSNGPATYDTFLFKFFTSQVS